MVVHRVGKVIGRDAVGLEQYLIDVVFRDGQRSLDKVVVFELVFDRAGGAEAQHPRLARGQRGLDVLNGAVAPDGVGAVITEVDLLFLLLGAHGGQLLLRAEARVGVTL